MKVNELFAKDIARPIEGVVKADDAANLDIEVEEYVLTSEAAQSVSTLLEEYNNYTNSNGVWISGFFGSGKSHLLKMLAHLLGDVSGQDFPREKVVSSFREKAADNASLTASITKSATIPATSILFNIDQKATLIEKDQSGPLLEVFVKVFDEARGYCGTVGHVARFESNLDEEGQFESFKEAFKEISGRDWEERRTRYAFPTVAKQVDEAYARVNRLDPSTVSDILKTYENNYSVSIEDFAESVKAWLDRQQSGYRLNFFVDEVGQFIGSNAKLMLNLQTIAESLNTKCGGRSWIFVTSQEDIDKVIGDRTKSQSNDFSKIQARFATRVKLNSADVEEVIQKRLLNKNNPGTHLLESLYEKERDNFRTLFDFADGARKYRNYEGKSHFTATYPFVPYQFPLFQKAIETLSDHNVFEGRHTSVGERSMLGVVQAVVKDLGESTLPALAPFDSMFTGISSTVVSAAKRSISVAENNLNDPLGVRLLKALFLVKYVDDFRATARNLSVLLFDSFASDITELTKKVEQSLHQLEAQTYVIRNGEAYEYLTNEEQEIETEIKNVDIDDQEVSDQIFTMLSSEIIDKKKIRYAKNGQDFSFGWRLDDQAMTKQHALTLHFITPANGYSLQEITAQSFNRDELRVVLQPDERLMSDLTLSLKTKKFIRLKQASSTTPSQQRILQGKATLDSEREKELVERLGRAIGAASLVYNGSVVDTSSIVPSVKIEEGFQKVIAATYHQLPLLGGRMYTEKEVHALLNAGAEDLELGSEQSVLATPAADVTAFVKRHEAKSERVTLKGIFDTFQDKPYGWDDTSIAAITAWLVSRGRLSLSLDSNRLKMSETANVLLNTQRRAHVIVALPKAYDTRQVANVKRFFSEFFDASTIPSDVQELASETSRRLKEKVAELQKIKIRVPDLPFVPALDDAIRKISSVAVKSNDWYLTQFKDTDELLELKDNTLTPILGFVNGQPLAIFNTARRVLNENVGNLRHIDKSIVNSIESILADPDCFRGNKMSSLKRATEKLQLDISVKLQESLSEFKEKLEARLAGIRKMPIYQSALEGARESVEHAFSTRSNQLDSQTQIDSVAQIFEAFEQETLPRLIDTLRKAQPSSALQVSEDSSSGTKPLPTEKPATQTISIKDVKMTRSQALLESEADVENYLTNLREALLEMIRSGKHILL